MYSLLFLLAQLITHTGTSKLQAYATTHGSPPRQVGDFAEAIHPRQPDLPHCHRAFTAIYPGFDPAALQ
jgi:hypothetical protein